MTRDRRYRFREDDLAIIKKVAPRVDSSLQALFMLAGAGLFYKGVKQSVKRLEEKSFMPNS
jgi:hypothetical protein